ncbi:MAG: 5-formyltetrahydrofolate cyclo-ligase [Spirochaetaceae bacterium]|nr:5-formyltetrahydrofolate cyclo-ligase [Spirochaetaceae bacterium]
MINELQNVKKEFREKIKTLNNKYGNVNFVEEDKLIINKVLENDKYKNCKTLLIYYPMGNEVNTISLIEKALENNKTVALPKIVKDEMVFIKIKTDWTSHLSLSSYKIQEPNMNEVIKDFNNQCLMIVPNLALAIDLSRIGHGKGYYDKFLKDKTNIFKIGICRSYLLFDTLPTDEYDIKLDLIISN